MTELDFCYKARQRKVRRNREKYDENYFPRLEDSKDFQKLDDIKVLNKLGNKPKPKLRTECMHTFKLAQWDTGTFECISILTKGILRSTVLLKSVKMGAASVGGKGGLRSGMKSNSEKDGTHYLLEDISGRKHA